MDITQFFGRLHPLFLHLPIGILALAFVMEFLGKKPKYAALLPAVGFAIQLGMWSAILVAISGYVLSWEGGYDQTMLNRHQYLGIGTAVLAVLVYLLHQNKKSALGKKLFFPLFAGLMLLIGITGHLGGSLTHGSDFLVEPFSGKQNQEDIVISHMDSAMIFQDLIQPIFKQKCIRCHNDSKIKGDLLMTSIEGIKKGGKNGAFLKAGRSSQSLFLQRAHLPLEEKKHMPPKGKKQLTKDELVLLRWWVDEGAAFDKPIASLQQPEEIKIILAKYLEVDRSVFALDIPPASAATIQELKQAGISISPVSKEKSLLNASLAGRKDVDKNILKKLQGISEQLISLDLSNTNMDDQLVSYLSDFPHLQKLFLQKTAIKGQPLKALEKLNYLEYLNLYDTPLEEEAIQSLAKFPALKNLYLWQTNLSAQAINQLKEQRPKLQINAGADASIFGTSRLKAPVILVDKEIFTDSIRVAFQTNFKGLNLFYTLDGTAPDSNATKYSEPFTLNKTTHIQVIAQKEGWETSPPAQQSVVQAKYTAARIKLNKAPNEKYKADGAKSLINLKKGSTNFSEGEWLGYEKSHVTVTLDMGESIELSGVSVSALESTGSYIFFPKNINVLISKDGKQYEAVKEKSIPTTAAPEPALTRLFLLNFEPQMARFVQVKIKSNLFNPPWHPAPGAPCWIFIDEIMVE